MYVPMNNWCALTYFVTVTDMLGVSDEDGYVLNIVCIFIDSLQ